MELSKNEQIAKTLAETRIKRQSQRCKVYQLKIDISKCNSLQKEQLKMYFVEAKWLYNHFLNKGEIFSQDYKINKIEAFDKDKNKITHELNYLPAKNKQIILQELKQNIYNLSSKKKKKYKIGKLKFKSDFKSINFNQYDNSHKIINSKRFKLQGIKKHLPVFGLKQLTGNEEIANCKLIKKPSGYYIHLTTYEYVKPKNIQKPNLGLDFGIKNNITTSNGEVYNISIEETERLKKMQQKLHNQKKGSNNRYKTRLLIQKEHEKITNRKKDAANKIVSHLLTNYNIFMQDENLKDWKEEFFGKQVQHSCLGLIKSKLLKSKYTIIIDKYFPTTKMCYNCGKINELELKERTFMCSCGLVEDRDIKAAKTIMYVGLNDINYTPVDHRKEPKI
jgi:putative transposase